MGDAEYLAANVDKRQPVEQWQRVMGYHRPVCFWNKGKQAEFAERKDFVESRAFASPVMA
jgi:anaerobic ribonucleoside-triphosphate reductase